MLFARKGNWRSSEAKIRVMWCSASDGIVTVSCKSGETRCRPLTCLNINVNVVNTDIYWDLHECSWNAWESRPIKYTALAKNCLQTITDETLR